jgi:SAM-dependent methyltransferase
MPPTATNAHSDLAASYLKHAPTYHTDKQAQYVLPNGSTEHLRLETQARHLSNIMNGQVIHAPVANPARILDVGCGTGVVTTYLAHQCPSASVYGVDLSPVPQLPGVSRPENVRFLQGNILTEKPGTWRVAYGKQALAVQDSLPEVEAFDLTYSRLLLCGISDWPKYIRTCYGLLRPATGWTEVHDLDWIWYRSDPETGKGEEVISDSWEWLQKLKSVSESRGLDFTCGSRTAGWMREAGFVDIETEVYRWPWGAEAGKRHAQAIGEATKKWQEFGEYVSENIISMFWHLIPRTMEGVVGQEEIEGMREGMVRDFRAMEGTGRDYWKFYVTWGRKGA